MLCAKVAKATDLDLSRLSVPDCERRIQYNRDWTSASIGAAIYWGLEPDLIMRIVEKGEKNVRWNTFAESSEGAVGLAQVMPLTVCRMLGRDKCYPNPEVLGSIAEKLKHRPHYNLCWSGNILAHLTRVCRGEKLCRSMIYNAGDAGLRYAYRVEEK